MAKTIRGKFRSSRVQALLAAGVLAAGMCFVGPAAHATTISASVGGVPTGADCYESFNSLALGGAGGTTTDCGIAVSFAPDAQTVQGSVSGQYAAPFLSNNNGTLFGDPTNGQDTTYYLTSGSDGGNNPNAAATLTFSTAERYLGLLWGSVDDYNTLTFYMNGVQVASFDGTDVANAAGAGNCIGGNQQAQGTCYVNINLSTDFNSVVATSSQYAFEFDNVAFATGNISVPEPGEIGLFLLGLLLIGSGYWYQRRKAV